jgi:hypothetical protein
MKESETTKLNENECDNRVLTPKPQTIILKGTPDEANRIGFTAYTGKARIDWADGTIEDEYDEDEEEYNDRLYEHFELDEHEHAYENRKAYVRELGYESWSNPYDDPDVMDALFNEAWENDPDMYHDSW